MKRTHSRIFPIVAIAAILTGLITVKFPGAISDAKTQLPRPTRWTAMVIDRYVDDELAVLLIGPHEEEHIVHRLKLPPGSQEGDWLFYADGRLIVDRWTTHRVRHDTARKMARLKIKSRASIWDGPVFLTAPSFGRSVVAPRLFPLHPAPN